MDLAAGYQLSSVTRVYARVDNLFDSDVIVSRSPAGARVNKPRAAILGFTVQFSTES
jgi:Fe(3+) dicitrate transport protein